MHRTEACRSYLHKQTVCSLKAQVAALITFSLNIWVCLFSVRWRAHLHEVLADIKEAVVTKMQTPDPINKCRLNTCYLQRLHRTSFPDSSQASDAEQWLWHILASLVKALIYKSTTKIHVSALPRENANLSCISCSETTGEMRHGRVGQTSGTHTWAATNSISYY